MKDDKDLQTIFDMAEQGLKEQSMNGDASNSSTSASETLPGQTQPDGQPGSAGVFLPKTAEDWAAIPKGRSAGSSRPLQTGIGARLRNHDNED